MRLVFVSEQVLATGTAYFAPLTRAGHSSGGTLKRASRIYGHQRPSQLTMGVRTWPNGATRSINTRGA
jgi:hypothetical protein